MVVRFMLARVGKLAGKGVMKHSTALGRLGHSKSYSFSSVADSFRFAFLSLFSRDR